MEAKVFTQEIHLENGDALIEWLHSPGGTVIWRDPRYFVPEAAGVFDKAPEYQAIIAQRTERLTHHLDRILWPLLFPDGAPLDTPEPPS